MADSSFANLKPTNYIYVSNSGSTAGDGSKDHPYSTIQDAVNHATPGTAVMVEAGTYVENIKMPPTGGTASAPIWLISADGPQAAKIIAATNTLPAIKALGTDNFVIKGFAITGGLNGIQVSQSGNDFSNMVSNVVIDGNVITNSVEDGVKISQANNVTVSNNTINTTGQEGVDFFAVNNSVIIHNDISNVNSDSAAVFTKGGSTNDQILYNYIHDIKSDGIVAGGWSSFNYDANGLLQNWVPGYTGYEAKNITIAGNVVESVGKRPLNVLGAQNVNAYGNFLEANAAYTFAVSIGDGSPQSPTREVSSDINIHDNTMTANKIQLYVAQGNNNNITFANNPIGTLADVARYLASAGTVLATAQAAQAAKLVADAAAKTATLGSIIKGNGKPDRLFGTSGADTFMSGGGIDTLTGGAGNDTYVIENAKDVIVEAAGGGVDVAEVLSSTFMLADNVEVLTVKATSGGSYAGNSGANLITGGVSSEILVGGLGNDTLTGGGGNDVFAFFDGDGSDVITDFSATDKILLSGFGFKSFADLKTRILQSGANAIVQLGGGDAITLLNTAVSKLTASQFDLGNTTAATAAGQMALGPNRVTGGPTSQVLQGGNGANFITSGGAGDVMIGGSGDDSYLVTSLDDRIVEFAGGGVDTAIVDTASYTMDANVENATARSSKDTTLVGNAIANRITGGGGNDSLYGGAGDDVLVANVGTDTLRGQDGDDTLISNNANLKGGVLDGGAGFDTAQINRSSLKVGFTLDASNPAAMAKASDGTIVTGIEAFNIVGTSSSDSLTTGDGDDTLAGGSGNDFFTPGGGRNVIDGGSGYDTLFLDGPGSDWTVSRSGSSASYLFSNKNGVDSVKATNVEQVVFDHSSVSTITTNSAMHFLSKPGKWI